MIKKLLKTILLTLTIATISIPVFAEGLNDYRLLEVSGIIEEDYILGITNYLDKLIIVKNDISMEECNITLYHEIAHALDGYVGKNGNTFFRYSESSDFIKIYNKENGEAFKELDNRDYYNSNIQEYFAQSFAYYIVKPNELKEDCPKTYQYMKKFYSDNKNETEGWLNRNK